MDEHCYALRLFTLEHAFVSDLSKIINTCDNIVVAKTNPTLSLKGQVI